MYIVRVSVWSYIPTRGCVRVYARIAHTTTRNSACHCSPRIRDINFIPLSEYAGVILCLGQAVEIKDERLEISNALCANDSFLFLFSRKNATALCFVSRNWVI